MLIYANEYSSIFSKKILCNPQAWIQHIQPVGMESAIAFRVLYESVAFFIEQTTLSKILLGFQCKIILIDKIRTSVVRGIDINDLDLAEICLLKQLQHIKVITLNVDILCIDATGCSVSADRLLPVKSQGFSNRMVGKYHRFLLIRPCELIAILRSFYNSRRNFLTQNVRINCTDNLTVLIYRFSHGVREHRGKFSEILLCQIGCMHLKILHVSNPPVPVYSHEGAYKVQIVSSAVAPSKRQPQSLLSASPISVSAPVERGAHPLKGKTIFQPAHHKAQSAPQKPPISHR